MGDVRRTIGLFANKRVREARMEGVGVSAETREGGKRERKLRTRERERSRSLNLDASVNR